MIQSILEFSGDYIHLEEETEMSILICWQWKNKKRFNREFRFKDIPTDVISFALEMRLRMNFILDFSRFLKNSTWNIGDIVISVDKQIEQASE